MKMMNMGTKDMGIKDGTPVDNLKASTINYPHLYLSDKIPVGLFEKNIGDMVGLRIVAKIMSKGINENLKENNKSIEINIYEMGLENSERDLEDEVKRQAGIKYA